MFRNLLDSGVGLGEPEMDANTALTELDKGLRSQKLGEQCEAIVRFPSLFEKYPFPILINSAFLKLADVFRTSTNFLRIWVLRVCQQSERHLDKIINVDEFIRRIFSVMHSNDPIARTLTLRTLGSLAGLIPERKSVHHCIRVSLDSSDSGEVNAAIYAATCFAKRSKTFATTMCTNISSMIKRITTPNDLKLRLIPIFKHMHHDVTVASTVLSFCHEILESYPSKDFLIVTLHAMTELAAATISDLKGQVSFLLGYLDDPRQLVKLCVLTDLKYLALKGGHLWDTSDLTVLVQSVVKSNSVDYRMEVDESVATEPDDSKMLHHTLDVIRSLATSSAVPSCLYLQESPLKELLESCIHSPDREIAIKGIQIASSIAVNWKNEKLLHDPVNLVQIIKEGIDEVLKQLSEVSSSEMTEKESLRYYEDWEKCTAAGVALCKAAPANLNWFSSTLVELLHKGKFPRRTRNIICQGIGAIGSFKPEAIQRILPDIFSLLESFTAEQMQSESNSVVILVAVMLQAHQSFILGAKAISICSKILSTCNLWDRYRIARNSFRYSQPGLAAKALEGIAAKVSTENFYHWISALDNIAHAESILVDGLDSETLQQRLSSATSLYLKAVMSLKAASSPLVSMQFQIEYMKIRSEMLVAFTNFLSACSVQQFIPPPAIAPSIVAVSRDELLKSGRVVTQLRKAIRDFQNVGEMYGRLYQTAFDAENDTLANLQLLQQVCQLVSKGLETVAYSKDHPSITREEQNFSVLAEDSGSTLAPLIKSCEEAGAILRSLNNGQTTEITQKHLARIQEAVKIIVETPLPYPRFFFQNLQTTRVKIAVSPQPRTPGENVSVVLGNNLVLKVEGVIEQTFTGEKNSSASEKSVSKCFRKPKSIRMTVISAPSQNSRTHTQDKQLNNEPSTIVKEVAPRKDFFSAQFLLGSWPSGLYTITVDTALIDYEGRVWMTGPRANLGIRVLSESPANMPSSSSSNLESKSHGSSGSGMSQSMNIPRPGPSGTPVHIGPGGSGRF